MKVLITTSGVGNRLGRLTKYTNKSLVRVGKKPTISYIIDSYPKNTDFIITTGYYGDHVKQYIKLAHPDISVVFCDVDKYDGDGSSLLYSMNCAKHHLQTPFIFHAGDTIISQTIQPNVDSNWCMSSHTKNTEHYRTHKLTENSSYIINIDEKGSCDNTFAHVGVSSIKNYELFWEITNNILNDFVGDKSLSDCHVINKMIEVGCKFEASFVNPDNWFDIGNVSSLNHAREHISDVFHILDKEDESIFILDNSVIKFFHNKETVQNRIQRMKYLKSFGPKLLNSTENFYKYEYINGREASQLTNPNDFTHLLNNLREYWEKISDEISFVEKTKRFYLDKTDTRAMQFLSRNKIEDSAVIVNGVFVPKVSDLLSHVPLDLITTRKKYHFHGDCVLDNIIITPQNNMKFIDWRQDFCGDIDGGDVYYDLGKMMHSLTLSHDLVSKKLFSYKETNISGVKNIELDTLRKASHVKFEELFNAFLKKEGFDARRVNLIKSLIWINMSPLHHYPFDHFLYYYGLLNLTMILNGD